MIKKILTVLALLVAIPVAGQVTGPSLWKNVGGTLKPINNAYTLTLPYLSDGCLTSTSGLIGSSACSGGGGTTAVATSTSETAGYLSYWTTTAGTPSKLGKVATTSLTATGPLSLSQPITVIGPLASIISCAVASGSVDGCLSSANWTTFNNKQEALVSGTNIKTINGSTLLGSGDLVVSGSPFPFTPTSYGVSTSTTVGFLNGLLSTASSTFSLLQVGNSTTTNATTTTLHVAGSATSTFIGGIKSPCFSNDGINCITGAGGSGTVTSVDMTVPTGLTISGNPVTTSGTLALALDTGYIIPLSASTTEWNNFYTTPSSRITAGTGLSWSGNTLNATGGSGTVNSGTQYQTAFYASNGTAVSGTSTLTIKDEKVGVGLTNPAYIFHVNGNDVDSLNSGQLARFENSAQGIGLSVLNPNSNDIRLVSDGDLKLSGGGSATDVITIASSLNVGIGSSTPSDKLSVLSTPTSANGTFNGASSYLNFSGVTGSPIGRGMYLSASSTDEASHTMYGLQSMSYGGVTGYGVYGEATRADTTYGGYFKGTGNAGTYQSFGVYGTASGGSNNNWAGYFNAGNVYVANNLGLGVATPTYKLDVSGAGKFTSYVDASYIVATTSTATSTFAGVVGIGTTTPQNKLVVAGGGISCETKVLSTTTTMVLKASDGCTQVIRKGTSAISASVVGQPGEKWKIRVCNPAGTTGGSFTLTGITYVTDDGGTPTWVTTAGKCQDALIDIGYNATTTLTTVSTTTNPFQ